jgi:peptidoglycan/xylan/chitin deacetylase (PgdA/CDA1 family)
VVLTHDVDTRRGHDRCPALMELEQGAGFRSSFNFVGGQYEVSAELRRRLVENGFEVGVHGWVHNASLYDSRDEFLRQAAHINGCLKEWGAVGFRSPCMYHNLEWLRELSISYDASTFDTDPFEPQCDGTGTIFPFFVPGRDGRGGFVELPYTLPQDFTLFVLFREKGIDTWKRKLDWVAGHGGMVLLNTHPDYMCFEPGQDGPDTYPARHYRELLDYLTTRYAGQFWHALPREVAAFCTESGQERETREAPLRAPEASCSYA